MDKVLIKIEALQAAWQSYVAAIHGDDGPIADATTEELTARDTKACEMLLAGMAKMAADHAIDRRAKAALVQIEAGVEAQRQALVATTVVSVEPVP